MDLFAGFGTSLARAHPLNSETGELDVLSIEDLVARTTALVCGHLRRRQAIDVKHAMAFRRLRGFGEARGRMGGSSAAGVRWLDEASQEAARLLESHPELVVVEQYSSEIIPCERCRARTIAAAAARIVKILGYF